jgi:hypothetical protein
MGGPGNHQLTSVVVLGAMNPLIHHPAWYQLHGLLTEQEAKEALANPQTLCTQPAAQLLLSSLMISCQLERWEVQTGDSESEERLVPLATRVFDELLDQTPVNTFGFNFNFERKTRLTDVGGFLARKLKSLAVVKDVGTSASFVWHQDSRERQASTTVMVSRRSPDSIVISNNFTHPIRGPEKLERFDLGPLVVGSFEVDRTEARGRMEQVLAVVESQGA